MRELSLHLMDIIENSITANSSLIEIEICENKSEDRLIITIKDNGCGMNSELLNNVTDPFVTTRKTRRVGLGISLFKSACERCEGSLIISSQIGKGTSIVAAMKLSHIDRAPIGRIEDTLAAALLNPAVDILYIHKTDGEKFIFDSREIKALVGDELGSPEILIWIKDYMRENIENIGGGV